MKDAHPLTGKSVLITGGLGFIGSSLAMTLVKIGAKVTLLDSLVENHGGNLFNINDIKHDVTVNISDLRDTNSLAHLVKDRDYIFHLAGQVSHGDSMRDPQLDLEVNCVSTLNLVETCRVHNPGVRLIYTSTRQVYGKAAKVPALETDPTIPIDVNGINKLAGEYYHLLYHNVYGLKSTILRLTNTYGPRQQIRNDRQGFVGIFIRKALKSEPLQVFGTGEQIRDFNYINDVCGALISAAIHEECYGEIYNLGHQQRHSLLEFVSIMARLTDAKFQVIPFPEEYKRIDIGDYYADWSKFNTATGWEPATSLEEGLALAIEFYRQFPEEYWK